MKNIVQTLLIILLGIQVSVADPIDRKKLLQAEIKRSAKLLTTQMQKNQKWVKLKQFKKLNYVIDGYDGKVVSLEMQQALNQKLIAFYLLTDVSFFVFITPGVPIYVPFSEKDKENMTKVTYERIKNLYPAEKNKELGLLYDYFNKLDWQYKLGSVATAKAKKLIAKIERKIQGQLRSENETMVYEIYQMAQYRIPSQQFALLTFRSEERLQVGLDKTFDYPRFRVIIRACSTPFSLENPCDVNDELDKLVRNIRKIKEWRSPQGGLKDRKDEYNTKTTSEGLVKYFSYLSMLKFIEGNEQRYKKKLLPEDIRNAPATTTVAVRGYIETLISNPLKLDYANNFKAFEEHPIWKLSQSNDPRLQALDEYQYTYYVSDLTKLTRKKYLDKLLAAKTYQEIYDILNEMNQEKLKAIGTRLGVFSFDELRFMRNISQKVAQSLKGRKPKRISKVLEKKLQACKSKEQALKVMQEFESTRLIVQLYEHPGLKKLKLKVFGDVYHQLYHNAKTLIWNVEEGYWDIMNSMIKQWLEEIRSNANKIAELTYINSHLRLDFDKNQIKGVKIWLNDRYMVNTDDPDLEMTKFMVIPLIPHLFPLDEERRYQAQIFRMLQTKTILDEKLKQQIREKIKQDHEDAQRITITEWAEFILNSAGLVITVVLEGVTFGASTPLLLIAADGTQASARVIIQKLRGVYDPKNPPSTVGHWIEKQANEEFDVNTNGYVYDGIGIISTGISAKGAKKLGKASEMKFIAQKLPRATSKFNRLSQKAMKHLKDPTKLEGYMNRIQRNKKQIIKYKEKLEATFIISGIK